MQAQIQAAAAGDFPIPTRAAPTGVVVGQVVIPCDDTAAGDARRYIPYLALPGGVAAPAGGGTPGARRNATVVAQLPLWFDPSAVPGAPPQRPTPAPAAAPSNGSQAPADAQAQASWVDDPRPRQAPYGPIPGFPLPKSVNPRLGAQSQIYHLRLRSFDSNTADEWLALYLQWAYSLDGFAPKTDAAGRAVLDAGPDGAVFLPPVSSSGTARVAAPAGSNLIFPVFSKDNLDLLLLQGRAPSEASARSLLLGPLTAPCMDASPYLVVDGVAVPNAGAAPSIATGVDVTIPVDVMSALLQRRGGATPAALPPPEPDGYTVTIAMAGFFFLLPGGFGEGQHRIEFGLRNQCSVDGEVLEQGTRVTGSATQCYPDPADCEQSAVVARTVELSPPYRAAYDLQLTRRK